MGIFVGKFDHINTEKVAQKRSKAWVGRFNPCNSNDMQEYEIVKSIVRNVNSGTKERFELERVDADFLDEYYPTPEVGSTAKPRYYATWDMGTIAIAPTPNAVYKFEIGITKKPTGLSSSNTTTWVSVNAERALLYACMVETFKFLKAPQDQQVYEQAYATAVQELAQEQLGKKRRDEYRDGSLRIKVPSQNP